MSTAPVAPHYRKTKIVATLGPASNSPEMIRKLIEAGANVFRLNFSHGTYDQHEQTLNTIRTLAAELDAPVAILQDLAGPKIRISSVSGDYVQLEDSKTITLKKSSGELSDLSAIFVEGIDPSTILKKGNQVLLADGSIELTVETVTKGVVTCQITKGGRMRSHVGIAFPGVSIDLPAATEKDFRDLSWGLKHEVDYVAISFVQTGEDIRLVKEQITKQKSNLAVIAKIERKVALDNISLILEHCDGLMVARGDLGLELPLEQVPTAQRNLIREANYRGIPVIVATQMLHSMITSIRPTRAEASDVATAVWSGTDAVMLSEETAIGENPEAAVKYLARIASAAEDSHALVEYELERRSSDRDVIPDAIAYAACAGANKVGAHIIIANTSTGKSARLVAKYRPHQLLFGASHIPMTVRQLSLVWGIVPITSRMADSHEQETESSLKNIQRQQKLPNGTLAVTIGGHQVSKPGSTSIIEIHQMNYL